MPMPIAVTAAESAVGPPIMDDPLGTHEGGSHTYSRLSDKGRHEYIDGMRRIASSVLSKVEAANVRQPDYIDGHMLPSHGRLDASLESRSATLAALELLGRGLWSSSVMSVRSAWSQFQLAWTRWLPEVVALDLRLRHLSHQFDFPGTEFNEHHLDFTNAEIDARKDTIYSLAEYTAKVMEDIARVVAGGGSSWSGDEYRELDEIIGVLAEFIEDILDISDLQAREVEHLQQQQQQQQQ